MSLINITDLTFTYEGGYDEVFSHVSFQIDTDWKLGFIGRNGRGKTTFLNLLLGKYHYSGSISSSVSFDYFPFHIADESLMTLQILEEIDPDYEHWKLIREFNQLSLSEDILYRPFNTLSNGEQTKCMLAMLFLKENNFLLIDEPTNHLDTKGRLLVADYLNSKKGFILVSHDRVFLDRCVDHILSINRQNIEVQKGNYTSWYENKQRQDNFELAKNEKLKKDIGRLAGAAKRTEGWSDKIEASKFGSPVPDRGFIGHKSAKMMQRSKSIDRRRNAALEEKKELLLNIESEEDLKLFPLSYHKSMIAAFRDVSVIYDNHPVFEPVTFEIHTGDRICLKGDNGSGKSSLIRLFLDNPPAYEGEYTLGSGLIISYLPQHTTGLSGNLKDISAKAKIEEHLFKALLRKLDLEREQFDKDVSTYSEGQKKKVMLAKSLLIRAHLYIWDEPLNYIDVISRIQIENLIRAFSPTLLFVEHDAAFCDNIATKNLIFKRK